MDPEYIRSERFIHDELLTRCAPLVRKVKELWRKDKRIYAHMLAWPSEGVRTQDSSSFTGVLFTELQAGEESARRSEIQQAAHACKAYAVLVVEQLEARVRLIFESSHGTRTWTIPIKDHGNVQVLGQATIADNAESVGVLWHAN